MPKTRFVIFGQGRSGSQLLCDLLDSHSQIRWDKEILSQPTLRPYQLILNRALLSSCNAYGFKVKIDQLAEKQRIRDVRITPKRIIDLVNNYDEMAASLEGTEFALFLNEPRSRAD